MSHFKYTNMIAKQLYFMENTLRVLQNVPKKFEYKVFFAKKLSLKVREREREILLEISLIFPVREIAGVQNVKLVKIFQ